MKRVKDLPKSDAYYLPRVNEADYERNWKRIDRTKSPTVNPEFQKRRRGRGEGRKGKKKKKVEERRKGSRTATLEEEEKRRKRKLRGGKKVVIIITTKRYSNTN